MSNLTILGGLRLYKSVNGDGQQLEQAIVLSTDSTPLGIGDAVVTVSAGATSLSNGPVVKAVTRAATTGVIGGVVMSTIPVIEGTGAINLGSRLRPASTAQYVLIRPAINEDVYEIQDDKSATLTAAAIGKNANLVISNADAATGQSKMYLNASTVATTATFQMKIIGVVQDATNDPTSPGCRWLVTLNNVERSGGTGTVGV